MKGGDTIYMDVQNTLCNPINTLFTVSFVYDMQIRLVVPYTIYESTTGNTLLFGIQTNVGITPEPRIFKLDKIAQVELQDPFTPEANYSPYNLKSVARIIFSV